MYLDPSILGFALTTYKQVLADTLSPRIALETAYNVAENLKPGQGVAYSEEAQEIAILEAVVNAPTWKGLPLVPTNGADTRTPMEHQQSNTESVGQDPREEPTLVLAANTDDPCKGRAA